MPDEFMKGRIKPDMITTVHKLVAQKTVKKLQEKEKVRHATIADFKKQIKNNPNEVIDIPTEIEFTSDEKRTFTLSEVLSNPDLLDTVFLESCNAKSEVQAYSATEIVLYFEIGILDGR